MGDLGMAAVKQYELSAFQFGIYVCTVYLGTIQLIGKDDHSILRGAAQSIPVGIIGELEIHAVGVAIQSDHGIGVQGGVIGHDDVMILFFICSGEISIGLQIFKSDGEKAAAVCTYILYIEGVIRSHNQRFIIIHLIIRITGDIHLDGICLQGQAI